MAVVLRGGRAIALDQRFYSWDAGAANVLGSAVNYADYAATALGTVPSDPWELYKTQPSVRTVVNFLSRSIAGVTLQSFAVGSDDLELTTTSPLAKMLAKPSPWATGYEFMRELVRDLALYERYLATLVRVNRDTWRLERVPPRQWEFVFDGLYRPHMLRFIDGSLERTDPKRFFWLCGIPDDVNGVSQLITMLSSENSANESRKKMWDRGAKYSTVIKRPLMAPDWSRAARSNFMTKLQDFQRGEDQEGGNLLLEDGMEAEQVNLVTPSDAQALETRQATIAEVCAAFGVNAKLLGLSDSSDWGKAVDKEVFYTDTLGTWFSNISSAFNCRLVPNISTTETVIFNVDEKLELSTKDKYAALQGATGVPFMAPNEARKVVNLPKDPKPEMDEIYVPVYAAQPQG